MCQTNKIKSNLLTLGAFEKALHIVSTWSTEVVFSLKNFDLPYYVLLPSYLWIIPTLRQGIFGLFQTHLLTMSA